MTKSDHIERKIKEGFESVEHKAPESVWSVINDNLDNNSQGIDDKVKSSFENNNERAPNGIWEGIEKQLTIDRGWVKVYSLLQRRTFYKWTKRAAAIFIFLFFVTPELNPTISKKESAKRSENKKEFQQKVKQETVPQDWENLIKVTSLFDNQLRLSEASDHASSSLENTVEYAKINYSENEISSLESNTEKSVVKSDLGDKGLLGTKSDDYIFSTPLLIEDKTIVVSALNFSKLPIKPVSSLPTENQNLELIDIKENILDKTKFEFGLYTAINSTSIVNNVTRRALDAKSLVAFNSSFGTNLGLQFVYHFDPKHSLASALMYSNVSQSYNKFSKGSLNEEVLNVNFVRLQTLYQFKYKRHESQKSAFNVKAGPYLGYMTTSNYLVNDELIAESLDSFKDFDFGVTFQAGHSIDWNKLVLDYGLNIDKGLTNLNKGTVQVPASFDKTTLLGLGAYVSLRYKL